MSDTNPDNCCDTCGWGTPAQCSCGAAVIYCSCQIGYAPDWLYLVPDGYRRIHDPATHGQDCSCWKARQACKETNL
jgi:hypothetical protein